MHGATPTGNSAFGRAPSFERGVLAQGGPSTGFDYLRIVLSLIILAEHAAELTTGYREWVSTSWFGPVSRAELGMFFALSGYLVAGSFARNNVPRFLALRALRIIPALAVEIVMTAVLIGAVFTTLPLRSYFQDAEFWAYFANIVGVIHFSLPGVFDGTRINIQFWTIPIEFECYFGLVVFALLGLRRNPHFFLTLVLAVVTSLTAYAVLHDAIRAGNVMPRWGMLLAFLGGVFIYLYEAYIPYNKYLFIVCVILTYTLLLWPNLVFLAPAPIAYITIYLGLLRLPKIPFGDLSYGIYLFHYPILLSIVHLYEGDISYAKLLVLGIPVTGIFATFSWNFIEKPILRKKNEILARLDRFFEWVSKMGVERTLRSRRRRNRRDFMAPHRIDKHEVEMTGRTGLAEAAAITAQKQCAAEIKVNYAPGVLVVDRKSHYSAPPAIRNAFLPFKAPPQKLNTHRR